MDIANFPSLSAEEFEEACHHFDRRYRQAKLGILRMHWKLRLRMALNATFAYQDMPRTVVEITRALEQRDNDEDLGLNLSDLAISDGPKSGGDEPVEADHDMMQDEASDEVIYYYVTGIAEAIWQCFCF